MMNGLTIGIVFSHEPIDQLQRCIESLKSDLQDLKSQIGKVQWVLICTPAAQQQDLGFFPGKVIHSRLNNLGYNRNLALRESQGEGFYFTDPDCWIEKGSFKKLFEAFEINKQNPSVFAFAGPNCLYSKNADLNKAFHWLGKTKWINGGLSQISIPNQNRYDWHSPTCHILYNQKHILNMFFSPRFFRVGEDLEYHFRMSQARKRILVCSDAIVWHEQRSDFVSYLKKVFFYGTAQTHLLRSWPSGFMNKRLLPLALFLIWLFVLMALPEQTKPFLVLGSLIAGSFLLFAEVLFYEGEKKFLTFSCFFLLVAGSYLTGQISGLLWPLPSMQNEETRKAKT